MRHTINDLPDSIFKKAKEIGTEIGHNSARSGFIEAVKAYKLKNKGYTKEQLKRLA